MSKNKGNVPNPSKSMKSNLFLISCSLASLLFQPARAQELWTFKGAVQGMTGHYASSQTLARQHGTGIRIDGEFNQAWGLTGSVQTTRIHMQPIVPTATQSQDNWMLSGHVHVLSDQLPGRWRWQLDAHQIHNNDITGQSDGVRVLAPHVTWHSATHPLKLDMGYATSHYKDTPAHHQWSYGLDFGFNQQQNWLQLRGDSLRHLTPATALGEKSTQATELSLTHFLSTPHFLLPRRVTVGVERGQKIYFVDIPTQTVYNLPYLNQGGEKIAATWMLNPTTQLSWVASQSRYLSNVPATHHFKLTTLAAQLTWAW
jgi:hypothetical protein